MSGADLTCYAFALAREHRFFRKPAGLTTPLDLPVRGWRGERGLLVETGIGADNVRRALIAVANHFAITRLIFAGFAGALEDSLRVGDVRAASTVMDGTGAHWTPTLATSIASAPLFTAPCLIGDPAEKRRLGSRHDAAIVDMESAHVARWCAERDLPWACVRAVSDDVETRLSRELLALMNSGRVSTWRVLKALARRPRLVIEMIRLAHATNHAARALARVLMELHDPPPQAQVVK